MSQIDWIVLVGALTGIVSYGIWRGRQANTLDGFILADRGMRWHTVLFSIMATQASAITFISTPGQAYVDGMRFVQFYLGLPIGMIILSITAVPIYHRLKVYTAYEFLENRFDVKTRTLAATFFLLQRGLAAGLTIFAPALILSLILGWNLSATNIMIGALVIVYTATGGSKALERTNVVQLTTAMIGMMIAVIVILVRLPADLSIYDMTLVAGKLGKMNALSFDFDWNDRYNFWSGLIGGLFLQLSYFGTDQSQVGRYLTGKSVAQSRLGLLFNGILKIPMQFFILYVGIMVFVFFQFVAPPLFFNSVEVDKITTSQYSVEWSALEGRHQTAFEERRETVDALVAASREGDDTAVDTAAASLVQANAAFDGIKSEARDLLLKNDPNAPVNDTNYIFLSFVMRFLPAGLIGLVIAAVFSAAMSSVSSELNALASTSVIDVYKRLVKPDATDAHYVGASKYATLFWGLYAIAFALTAHRFAPSLIELVNIIGSLFYGTILGMFLLAFYAKNMSGTATFTGALVAEAVVIYCKLGTNIAWLWFSIIGCIVTVGVAYVVHGVMGRNEPVGT